MRRLPSPRLLIILLVTAVVTALLSVGSAQADAGIPRLLVKGPGSNYTDAGGVALTVAAGSTASFGIKLINTDPTPSSYLLELQSSSLPATTVLYSAGFPAKPMIPNSDGYYPVTLAAGATRQMTLKVTMPASSPQFLNQTSFVVLSESGSFLTGALATTNIKAPAHGTSSYEIYARNGTQPFIGGEVSSQFAMAPPLATGATASFTVKLQNDGAAPATLGLEGFMFLACADTFPFTVRDGTTDVTAAVLDGSYRTPSPILPGRSRTLHVSVRNNGATQSCTNGAMHIGVTTADGTPVTYVYLVAARKAT